MHQLLTILLFTTNVAVIEPFDGVHAPVYRQLRALEKDIGCKLIISSGYRTKKHNKAVGGADRSYHLFGLALDVVVRDCQVGLDEVYKASRTYFSGVIKYPGHIHLDLRRKGYINIIDSYEFM